MASKSSRFALSARRARTGAAVLAVAALSVGATACGDDEVDSVQSQIDEAQEDINDATESISSQVDDAQEDINDATDSVQSQVDSVQSEVNEKQK